MDGPASHSVLVSEKATDPETPQDAVSATSEEASDSSTPKSKLIHTPLPKNVSKHAYITKKLPFLTSSQVGRKAGRISVQEPDKPKKTLMTFCLECVRPHLYVYCDGTKELKTHHCDYHVNKSVHPESRPHLKLSDILLTLVIDRPNPRHWTNYYSEIRRIQEHRFQHPWKKLAGRMRRLTQPILKHRKGCEHGSESGDGDFDEDVLAALLKVARYEGQELYVYAADESEDET